MKSIQQAGCRLALGSPGVSPGLSNVASVSNSRIKSRLFTGVSRRKHALTTNKAPTLTVYLKETSAFSIVTIYTLPVLYFGDSL